MKTLVGKFTFAVPDGHPDAGKKYEKPFTYEACESDSEAESVLKEKKWSIREFVDETLKSNARSNAYQAALLPFKPSELSPEEIQERMVRDYIRLGFAEDVARVMMKSALEALAKAQAETVATE